MKILIVLSKNTTELICIAKLPSENTEDIFIKTYTCLAHLCNFVLCILERTCSGKPVNLIDCVCSGRGQIFCLSSS